MNILEATHFTQDMIEYLRKRMRSARAAHKKQMVLTCNPDPDWFGLEWIKPYLTEDGTPDLSKDGKPRYYVVEGGNYVWSDSREELEAIYGSGPDSGIQSFTFISANCTDNIPLMKADPSYLGNLKAQPYVDVQRYLYGNWLVRPSTSGMIRREWLVELDSPPAWTEIVKTVRVFDLAGTLKSDAYPSPDYTASVRMAKLKDGTYCILDVKRTRIRFGDWKQFIIDCSMDDAKGTDIVLPIDPNPAAKAATMMLARELSALGFYVRTMKASSSKVDRFRPFASMAQNGGIKIVKDCGMDYENKIYNDLNFFYREAEAFDGTRRSGENGHDDMVDCCSDAFMALAQRVNIPSFASTLQSVDLSVNNPFR